MGKILSDAQVEGYRRDGYVFPVRIMASSEAADLRAKFEALEAETGLNAGWHGTGAIRLALNDTEVDWFRYVQGMLNLVGVESHLISPSEILDHHPLLDVSDVKLGFWTPNDGWSDPTGSTNAMARGARQLGCR